MELSANELSFVTEVARQFNDKVAILGSNLVAIGAEVD